MYRHGAAEEGARGCLQCVCWHWDTRERGERVLVGKRWEGIGLDKEGLARLYHWNASSMMIEAGEDRAGLVNPARTVVY